MRIPDATTAALVLSVSSVAVVLTSADAKTKTGGVLGASYHRGAKRHAFARRSLQPKETDGVELIYPKPLFQPRKHGKTTGDRDEDGLLLGHGYMDDLDPRGATGAEPKPLKSHKGTIESNQVLKQDGANGNADSPSSITSIKSKAKDAVGEAAKQDNADTSPTIKTPKSKGTDAVSEAVKQDDAETSATMKTPKSPKGTDATGEAVKQDANGDIPTNMTPKSKSAKGAMTSGADTDANADDAGDTDVREEVVCVPRPGARGPDGVRSDSIGGPGAGHKSPKAAKTAKTAKSAKMPKAGKNTRRGMRRLSPKGPKEGKVSSTIDSDCDGLTDAEEMERGTNPYDADSDGDGVNDKEELEQGTNPTVWDHNGKHTVSAIFTPNKKDDTNGGAAAISSTVGAQSTDGINRSIIPIIAMAATTLLVGLILLLVGKKNRDKRLNMREDELGLRKNANMLPYDFEDSTEYSGSDGSKMVLVVGDSRALDLSDDVERALAANNVHRCQSSSCPTCTLAGKEPVFIDVEGDAPPVPPSELRRNDVRNVGHVVGASNNARASEVMAALSFATGSVISSDESSLGLKSAAAVAPPDVYGSERRQRNDDLSVMANENAERKYENGDTVDL